MSDSAAEHLVSSLFLGPSDCVAMFTGYFDESYQTGAAVVAGVICHRRQFLKFDKKWRALLSDFEIEDGFYMKDFVARHHKGRPNQYTDWGQAKETRFFQRLVRVIANHTEVSIGVVLDKKVYGAFRSTPERKAAFKSEYLTASWLCLILADAWAAKRPDVTALNLVFDRGEKHGHEFKGAYDATYKGHDHFSSLTFADDLKVTPLQGADFVAYELGKAWTSHTIDKRARRKSYRLAGQLIKTDWRVVHTPKMLHELAALRSK